MPVMNGYEVCEHLRPTRALPAKRSSAIIALPEEVLERTCRGQDLSPDDDRKTGAGRVLKRLTELFVDDHLENRTG